MNGGCGAPWVGPRDRSQMSGPRNLGGTHPYDIPRFDRLIWLPNSRFDMSDGSKGGLPTLRPRCPTSSRIWGSRCRGRSAGASSHILPPHRKRCGRTPSTRLSDKGGKAQSDPHCLDFVYHLFLKLVLTGGIRHMWQAAGGRRYVMSFTAGHPCGQPRSVGAMPDIM